MKTQTTSQVEWEQGLNAADVRILAQIDHGERRLASLADLVRHAMT